MNLKRTSLSTAFSAIVGSAVALAPVTASAIIPDGHYRMVINDTPYNTALGRFVIGSDGNWNSSFTFGCYPGTKGCISQAMYDTGLSNPNGGSGSGIGGDGVSGVLDITVTGSVFTVNTFSKDAVRFTAGGDFFQYTNPVNNVSQMGGTIVGTTMTYNPTNRLASITSPVLVLKLKALRIACHVRCLTYCIPSKPQDTGSRGVPDAGSIDVGLHDPATNG